MTEEIETAVMACSDETQQDTSCRNWESLSRVVWRIRGTGRLCVIIKVLHVNKYLYMGVPYKLSSIIHSFYVFRFGTTLNVWLSLELCKLHVKLNTIIVSKSVITVRFEVKILVILGNV